MFHNKSKKKGSSKNVQILSCNNSACQGVYADLIQCNIWTKYVCEQCNVIPIAKLKALVEKCSSIYFICSSCNEGLSGTTSNNQSDDGSNIPINDGEKYIVTTLNSTVNKSISELKSKLVKLIDSNLDEKMEKVLSFGESMKQQNETLNKINHSYEDSAKVKQSLQISDK